MQIRNLILLISRRFRWLQGRSEFFWKKADNSYFASPAFYEARAEALRNVLLKIGQVKRAIDVGCGDGRFTSILKDFAEQVDGYDLSEKLIAAARMRLNGNEGIRFHVTEIEQIPNASVNDVVACLGVTTCLIDNRKFERALNTIVLATASGGYLILIDTLSDGKEITRAFRSGYIGKYRQRNNYESELLNRGMRLVESHRLADMGEDLGNYFYVFQRHSTTCDSKY